MSKSVKVVRRRRRESSASGSGRWYVARVAEVRDRTTQGGWRSVDVRFTIRESARGFWHYIAWPRLAEPPDELGALLEAVGLSAVDAEAMRGRAVSVKIEGDTVTAVRHPKGEGEDS